MDEYHLAEQIGEGSFGKVFKGRRRYTSQIVALKLINKHGKSEKDMRNLRQVCAAIISPRPFAIGTAGARMLNQRACHLQEIDIQRRLDHPNIILLLDAFETPHEFCLVTEFAEGELFEILEAGTPDACARSCSNHAICLRSNAYALIAPSQMALCPRWRCRTSQSR